MQSFSLDHLSETEFEEFCYDLLRDLGFFNINWRKGTGLSTSPSDRGRDIECQRMVADIDETSYLETWFVECKHYKQGVPPDKIQGAISWATSERPDKLLIIASNFLSNPSKDFLENYIRNNKPSFKIRVWEKQQLEKLSSNKTQLLRKYRVIAPVPIEIRFEIAEGTFISYLQLLDEKLRLVLSALEKSAVNKDSSLLPEKTGKLLEIMGGDEHSVVGKWKKLLSIGGNIAGDNTDKYTMWVIGAEGVGLEYAHGGEIGHRFEEQVTAERLVDLSHRLEEVISFIEYYAKHVSQNEQLKDQ